MLRSCFLVTVLTISTFCVELKLSTDYEDYNFEDYKFEYEEIKESTCSNPGPIKNGKTDVWGEGLLLEYSCDEGFTAVGITHGACNVALGKWTIDPIVCVTDDCSSLEPPENGIVTIENGLATITCRQGYHLVGSSVLLCEEEYWSGEYPSCLLPGETPNVTESEEEKLHRELVEKSDESCFNYHVEPPKLLYSLVSTSYVINPARGRYVMLAKYTCVNGYKLVNPMAAYLYCMNSKWTAKDIPTCVLDGDPCETENGGCQHTCIFHKRVNRFECKCRAGFTLGPDDKSCVDVDECLIENGGCQQICHNIFGSFACGCKRGYLLNDTRCVDINECKTSKKTVCPGPCINKPGSYYCDCDIPGYRPSKKDYFCIDIDECEVENGGCQDKCENTRGSYVCRCEQKGWQLAPDNHSCIDVDECVRYGEKICRHGNCVNEEGSYRCLCNDGFQVGTGNRYCEDINECAVNNGGCEDTCTNVDGSYSCNCTQPGFVMASNGFSCKDIDECIVDNGGCEGRCRNSPGSYRCTCPAVGVVLADDKHTCIACTIDEFYLTRRRRCIKCPVNSERRSSRMGFSIEECVCKPGFRGNPAANIPCVDLDECELGEMKCEFECINTIGGAHCGCPQGFGWHKTDWVCRDLDECSEDNGGCSHVCTNYPGSYKCSCYGKGYILDGDGHACQDINECDGEDVMCDYQCENSEGSYRCICPTGHQLNNITNKCDDIDECSWESRPCNQSCTNIPGSFLCNCDGPGFKLSWDNNACIDINECMEGNNPCGESCQNTIGSFVCECNKNGYTASSDGLKCRDINECNYNHTKVCDQLCINLPGSYRCECNPGYRKLGSTKCATCPEGYYRGVRDKTCRRCPLHSMTENDGAVSIVECVCKPGYKGDPSRNLKCQDIDECVENFNHGCSHGCVNNVGSAYCTCEEGYRLDLDYKTCVDKDECKTRNGGCEQTCINTPGSFRCECNVPYYTLAKNGKSCNDVDECEDENHACSHVCINIREGYRCGCNNGYGLEQDNRTCSDINECENNKGRCSDTCVNSEGSYRCECNVPGFQLHSDGKQCIDVNECLDENLCEDKCENMYGSYKCVCTQGNVNLSPDAHSCDDLDECASNLTNACDQVCVNLPGTYRCSCYVGYYKTRQGCKLCPKNSYRDSSITVTSCQRCPRRSETAGDGGVSIHDCRCRKGYTINNLTRECVDIDECSEDNKHLSGCEHKCYNLPGRYFCSCPRGSRLQPDRKSCSGSRRCKPLKKIKKGIIWPPDCLDSRSPKLTPGITCAIRCHKGYKMTGSKLRTCTSNGVFSGSDSKCSKVKCGRLKEIQHGKLFPPRCREESVPYGQRCRIRCDKGYILKGRVGTKCRATERWSHRLRSQCVKDRNAVEQ